MNLSRKDMTEPSFLDFPDSSPPSSDKHEVVSVASCSVEDSSSSLSSDLSEWVCVSDTVESDSVCSIVVSSVEDSVTRDAPLFFVIQS